MRGHFHRLRGSPSGVLLFGPPWFEADVSGAWISGINISREPGRAVLVWLAAGFAKGASRIVF
jgi:hypothetical protein